MLNIKVKISTLNLLSILYRLGNTSHTYKISKRTSQNFVLLSYEMVIVRLFRNHVYIRELFN